MDYTKKIETIIYTELISPTFPSNPTFYDFEGRVSKVINELKLIARKQQDRRRKTVYTKSYHFVVYDNRNANIVVECNWYIDKPPEVFVSEYMVLSPESIELIDNYKTAN